jgi:16S rRNA (cytidine1402-2'-O)-methyltransferase
LPPETDPVLSSDGIFHADWITSLPGADLRPGTLYIVSTPIGDIEDISIRALRVLKSVSVIIAENPPVTRVLLQRYKIPTAVVGIRARAGEAPIQALVERLQAGDTAALVTDAGTPMIADAGSTIVRAARRSGLTLAAVPGPVAAIAALVLAGAVERFSFDGFPPRARADRVAYFAALGACRRTLLLYETRKFLRDTLTRLRDSLGADRAALVARDLTKATETLYYGTFAESVVQFQNPPQGEYTIVICGT